MKRASTRMLAGGIDQILSSVSNAVVVFAVARAGRAADFGHAAVMFSIVAAAVGIARGAFGTPLLLSGGSGDAAIRHESRCAATGAVLVGVVAGLIVAGTAILLHDPHLGVAFAVAMPLVLAQDALRFAAITAGRPHVALASDGLWTLVALALLGLTWFDTVTPSALVLVWGWALGALAALLVLCALLGLLPGVRGLIDWWRPTASTRLRFALDSGLEQTTVIAVISISTVVVGPVAAAALRGAATVLGPFAILLSALMLVALPEASRAERTVPELWRSLRTLTLPASAAALALGFAAHVVPDRLGVLVLGDTWAHAAGVLPWLGVEYAALCWVSAVYNIFRYRRDTRLLIAGRTTQAVCSVVLCLVLGVIFRTPVAVAAALAATGVLTAILLLIVTARDRNAKTAPRVSEAPVRPTIWAVKHGLDYLYPTLPIMLPEEWRNTAPHEWRPPREW